MTRNFRGRQPSRGDRHTSNGKVIGAGGVSRLSLLPPTPKPGQVACPICRNAVGVTTAGNLRSHVDLFGNRCPNRSQLIPVDVETPPVVLPPAKRGNGITAQPRSDGRSRLDAGSECRECGKWLPGERSLCGRCYVRQGR